MGVISDAAVSRGDVMRELAELRGRVQSLETARRLEAASVGRGGLRVAGGRLLAEDAGGERVFEVTTDPPSIFMRAELISSLVETIVEELLISPAGRTLIDGIVADLLTSPAGQTLAAFVLAQRFRSASASGQVSTSSTSYVSLSGGPSLSNVPVSESGTMIVMVGAEQVVSAALGQPDQGAAMSFQVSGASSVGASDANAKQLGFADLNNNAFLHDRSMAIARVTGLNPGNHTVAARYRRYFGSDSVSFQARTLVAIGL